MSPYKPPEQSRLLQFVDILFLLLAIFGALWLPLEMKLAGAAKQIDRIDHPTWETLQQTPAQVTQWQKLGYGVAQAHDVIQNRFHYAIDWRALGVMTIVVLG